MHLISLGLTQYNHSLKHKYSSQHLKWIKKVNQSCQDKNGSGSVQTSCITLITGFDPLQMLTTVY